MAGVDPGHPYLPVHANGPPDLVTFRQCIGIGHKGAVKGIYSFHAKHRGDAPQKISPKCTQIPAEGGARKPETGIKSRLVLVQYNVPARSDGDVRRRYIQQGRTVLIPVKIVEGDDVVPEYPLHAHSILKSLGGKIARLINVQARRTQVHYAARTRGGRRKRYLHIGCPHPAFIIAQQNVLVGNKFRIGIEDKLKPYVLNLLRAYGHIVVRPHQPDGNDGGLKLHIRKSTPLIQRIDLVDQTETVHLPPGHDLLPCPE